MNKSELEQLLFQHTENEKKYAIHNASLSNRYTTAQTISIDNQELMYFHLDTLDKNKIMIRKDSRYIGCPSTPIPASTSIIFILENVLI